MQKSNGARRSGRKRKSNVSLDEYRMDEDYVETVPPKRTRRMTGALFSDTREHCEKLLHQLMKHPHGWPFNQPVDPEVLGLADYLEKTAIPMDFGTIQQKLVANAYEDTEQFAADVRLVFSNCWNYNGSKTDVSLMATVLSGIFEKKYKGILSKASKIHQGDEISQMRNVIAELQTEHQKLLKELNKLVNGGAERSHQSSGTKQTKKKKTPKERTKVKADTFTVKQKKKLTEKIGQLTSADLDKMVELLSADIPESQRVSGELEIDLEKLAVPTLKKLDTFVNDCLRKQNQPITPNGKLAAEESSSSDSDSSSSSSDSSDSESEPEKAPGTVLKAEESTTIPIAQTTNP